MTRSVSRAVPAALLLLAACSPGSVNRGLESVHQPVVGDRADVPACPDWSRPSQPDFQASTTSNYGCAASTNLAAMVADPQDLLRGRSDADGTDARVIAKGTRTYRDKPSTGLRDLTRENTGRTSGGSGGAN